MSLTTTESNVASPTHAHTTHTYAQTTHTHAHTVLEVFTPKLPNCLSLPFAHLSPSHLQSSVAYAQQQ